MVLFSPRAKLVGRAKVELEPGETEEITVTLDPNATLHPLSYWNVNMNGWETASGDYQVYVGASSLGIRLTDTLRVHRAE
jgi:beta-glucosidase